VESPSPPVRESVEFTRIVAFTDGVFAIAITLLVLSLGVPERLAGPDLHDFLLEAWPQFFAYFLSFAVIGRFWISHHELFSLFGDFDRRLLMLNLAYLSLVVLIPFPTELLGDYGDRSDPVVLYAFVVGSALLLSGQLIRAGVRWGHVVPARRAEALTKAHAMMLPAAVFYVSIPVALVSPLAGQLTWILLIALRWRR